VAVVAGAGAVEFEEDDGRLSFQKLEELAGSALSTSLLFSGGVTDAIEGFEGERVSQVARLLGAGFSVAVAVFVSVFVSAFFFSDWDLSVTAVMGSTVALRMGCGFFFSACFISAGSSETSSFSRPIIHQPDDLVWTRTDSVFLSSMSPIKIRRSPNQLTVRRRGRGNAQPMFLIAILNLFQSHR
jgi:hypothetical protein